MRKSAVFETALLVKPPALPVVSDWSPDDRKALIYQHISANENNLWIIDVKTGEKTLLTPKEENKQTA